MAKKRVTLDTVRQMASALPGVEEGTSWGTAAFKVRGKMFACVPIHRSAEPDSLVVMLDFARRDEMLAADPDVYYLKEHYVNYPCLLVRLGRVHPDALSDLLTLSHRYRSAPQRRRNPRPRAR